VEYTPKPEKKIRSQQYREWIYTDRKGNPLVKVCRVDDGLGKRKIWQQRYENNQWVNGLDGISREEIAIFNYQKIKEKIRAGERIFLVEGESCCDALNELGLIATTNLGGSGEWTNLHSQDLIEVITNVEKLEQQNVNSELKVNDNLASINNNNNQSKNSQNNGNNNSIGYDNQQNINSDNSNLEANRQLSNNDLVNNNNQQIFSQDGELANNKNLINNHSVNYDNQQNIC